MDAIHCDVLPYSFIAPTDMIAMSYNAAFAFAFKAESTISAIAITASSSSVRPTT